eukprot:Clim_evm44s232 gene=Clim_evmTU44s232
MSASRPVLVAVAQTCCTRDIARNLEECMKLIKRASSSGAKMLFLPEAVDFIGESRDDTYDLAMTDGSAWLDEYCKAAKEHAIWLSLGGIHQRCASVDGRRIYNRHLLLNSSGTVCGQYDKLHMFDIDIKDGPRLMESSWTKPGDGITDPIETPAGSVGLGICYDMRFPEFATHLRRRGATILTYPSAFTEKTGAAHWEVLLRSRAIETQCYVIAAAQAGKHNKKRSSYGHALIVDPWGVVVAQTGGSGFGLAFAEIDLSQQEEIRKSMPTFEHRRDDVY